MKAVLLIFVAGWCACQAYGETVYRRSMDRVSSLDPADAASIYAARSAQLVYETLLEYDYRARPYRLIPGLAAALPEVQSNGLVYVVRLDPEARSRGFTLKPAPLVMLRQMVRLTPKIAMEN